MAALTLEALAKAGALVSSQLVKKEVVYCGIDGQTYAADVWIKPLSYAATVASVASKDQVASRIAASCFDENGNQLFAENDITGAPDINAKGEVVKEREGAFNQSLTIALLAAIGEVSGVAQKKTS